MVFFRMAVSSLALALLAAGCSASDAESLPGDDENATDEGANAADESGEGVAAVSAVGPMPRVLPVPVGIGGTATTSAQCVKACKALIDYYKSVCDGDLCTDADKNNCPILRARYLEHKACAEARNEYTYLCADAMNFTPDSGHRSAVGRAVDSANQCAKMFNAKPKCTSKYGGPLTYSGGLTPKGNAAKAACGF